RTHPVRVVRHIEQPFPSAIEPTRHAGDGESFLDRFPLRTIPLGQRHEHAMGNPGIATLMRAPKPKTAVPPIVGREHPQTGAASGTAYHLDQPWTRLSDDEWHPPLRDPRLLHRDLLQRVAEVLHVIHFNLRHRAHERRDDIGAVETPAQSHFDHGDVYTAR